MQTQMMESQKPKLSPESIYAGAFSQGLRPEPDITVSQWADEKRRLSQKASSEPGLWRTSRTPYLREIMDCLSISSAIETVIFMAGAQIGKTETGNNWVGYIIDNAPAPLMIVQPTVELAKRFSKQRIDAMIEETPVLQAKIKPARERDSGNTVLQKDFPGGMMALTGANSAVGLRSMPAKYLFMDEVDAYPADVDGEGDPVELAEARARTFPRKKKYLPSTPTIKGRSKVEHEYELSDQRRYYVPCPCCGEKQPLVFENLRWEKGKPETVVYVCAENGCVIEEHSKTWFLDEANGAEWVATAAGDSKTAGFHLSSLYSPLGWLSWQEIASKWEKAQGKAMALKVFKNTILAETWEEKGEAPEWERLYERREDYSPMVVPQDVCFLTAGADVQKDRLELTVWGWGYGAQRWYIDHIVLEGDPVKAEVWKALDAELFKNYRHVSGADMKIMRMCVDSGYETQSVYAWVRGKEPSLVTAIKGVERGPVLVGNPSAVDISLNGKRVKNGMKFRPVVSGIGKMELYSYLRLSPPVKEEGETYQSGYVHLPNYCEPEFLKQLCAEKLVTRAKRGGYARTEWEKTRDRNEALDCAVYARAAAALLGMDRFTDEHWQNLTDSLLQQGKEQQVEQTKRRGRRVRHKGMN